MLSPYRVLDLTDEDGLLCGQILADLGADVIQVEPREGSSARRVGPRRAGDENGVEGSLFWAAFTRNKRGIALDLESDGDRATLLRLVAGADFLIESARPGRMRELGLDHDSLARVQPGIVSVSITPFGETGPKAHWHGSDLTQVAASGFGYLTGDADGPPTRVCVPQAHAHAGVDAAVGALLAHFERKRSGRGQHVDISQQQSLTLANMFRTVDAAIEMAPAQRVAGGLQAGGVLLPTRHRTRDGWVVLGPSVIPSTGHFMTRLLEWVAEAGFCDSALAQEEWGKFAVRVGSGKLPPDAYDPTERALDAFFATKTNAEVMAAAVERKLLIAPVFGIDEIIESEQLAARDYVATVVGGAGLATRYPGPFAKFSATPIRYRIPAPRLDEHAQALRAESQRVPAATSAEPPGRIPLDGVKVLDLFWVLAGPTGTRMLADYGATVVRVESRSHLDTLRVSPPWQFTQPNLEGAAGFQSANANKLGITLDLASDECREVIFDLVRWADVVTESFAPGVMDSLGIGWEVLRGINPNAILVSSCLMGQSGPWRDFTGFGRLAVGIAGFQQLASWPGRPPAGPYGAYTDAISSRYNALAILAALEHRDRTGEAQTIDLSQTEAALHFLTPAFLDWTVNGNVQGPVGNDDPDCFPHGLFSTAGEDCWVAISVRREDDWLALCEVIGRADLVERRDERDVVDAAIASFTRERTAPEIEAMLQAAGIAAHEALDMPGLFADPQLRHRGHFIEIAHDVFPTTTIESSRLKLSQSPERVPERALSLGRDNTRVLSELLGYSGERIAKLGEQGVLR
ncbi:MAG: CoA transferase [Deltaproteobacteria bacterium]|nr:CoA transferase [Deltaproteobacteria bacterium]